MLLGGMARRLRTRIDFAEQELVIPSGPFEGRRFSTERQPFTRLLLQELDRECWPRCFIAGPTQSGKSLTGFVSPVLYHQFEIGEDVICLLPHMELAKEKWQADLLPAIERTRYRELLPRRGGGSQGGTPTVIRFANGTSLRFVPGGGSDKTRAGYTARVVVITEVDGMDEAGETSREADPITQIEGRTRAFGRRKRIYGECTVSIEQGRTWQELIKGTNSRIMLLCPRNGCWVCPERDDVKDWQDAETLLQARERATLYCPGCGEAWSEEDRRTAHRLAKLLHRGQEITKEGLIVGSVPETDTFGFRWNAVNNFFQTIADIGGDEWKALRAADQENAEKAMRQFVWTLPVIPDAMDTTPLDQDSICRRQTAYARRQIPPGATMLSIGVDLGAHVGHYVIRAGVLNHPSPVIDYGTFDVPSRDMPIKLAILKALRELYDKLKEEYQGREFDEWWIDSGYEPEPVYQFCEEMNEKMGKDCFRPTKGHGAKQFNTTPYAAPSKKGPEVRFVGDNYHFSKQQGRSVMLAHVNADHWKSELHKQLTCKADAVGACVLFQARPQEHLTFARHHTAEKQVEEFERGRGMIVHWERVNRQNHYLDADVLATCGVHHMGARVLPEFKPAGPDVITNWFAKQREGR